MNIDSLPTTTYIIPHFCLTFERRYYLLAPALSAYEYNNKCGSDKTKDGWFTEV